MAIVQYQYQMFSIKCSCYKGKLGYFAFKLLRRLSQVFGLTVKLPQIDVTNIKLNR